MKIIDTHCHLGISKLSGLTITEDDLLSSMDEYGVDISLVMPHAVVDDTEKAHQDVAKLSNKYSDRFRGIINLSPLINEAEYADIASSLIRDRGFVAIKLNPMQHLTSPMMPNAEKVFSTAAKLDVPVIIHTGPGIPWALPSLAIPKAMEYPETPIILAHAGFAIFTDEAQVAAMVCKNIYLEPSWSTVEGVRTLNNNIGSERIMLGSDNPDNLPVELAKYKAAHLEPEDMENCMSKTATQVFKLDI